MLLVVLQVEVDLLIGALQAQVDQVDKLGDALVGLDRVLVLAQGQGLQDWRVSGSFNPLVDVEAIFLLWVVKI